MQIQVELPNTLDMPVRTYEHPETGSRVTFIGMIHAAQPAFFETIRERAERLQGAGATIFLEAPAMASKEEFDTLEPEIRERMLALRGVLGGAIEWGKSLGLVFQADYLPPREDWEMPDATLLERARLLDEPTLNLLKRAVVSMESLKTSVPLHEQRATFVQNISLMVKSLTDASLRDMLAPGVMRELESLREGKVLAALEERRQLEPDCDVVLIWGTEHLPAFDAALTELGYKAVGVDMWETAINVVSFMEPEAA